MDKDALERLLAVIKKETGAESVSFVRPPEGSDAATINLSLKVQQPISYISARYVLSPPPLRISMMYDVQYVDWQRSSIKQTNPCREVALEASDKCRLLPGSSDGE